MPIAKYNKMNTSLTLYLWLVFVYHFYFKSKTLFQFTFYKLNISAQKLNLKINSKHVYKLFYKNICFTSSGFMKYKNHLQLTGL